MSFTPSCRILVLSSDASHSRNLIDKILDHTQLESSDQYQSLDPIENVAEDDEHIEWIISNKYYTAPVHFLPKRISLPPAKPLWPPEDEDEKVPAIIFVFADGEDYTQRFLSMKEGLEAHGAEVTIAVRTQVPGEDDANGTEDEDAHVDAETITEFFSDLGFEFIDLTGSPQDQEPDAPDQGIPRIVGALHTIMWPSLVRKDVKIGSNRRTSASLAGSAADASHSPALETSALPTEDFDPPFASFLGSDVSQSLFESADGALQERDLQALEAWLDGDEDEAWRGYPSQLLTKPMVSSNANPGPSTNGFDDDFTEFVSAVPPTHSTHGQELDSASRDIIPPEAHTLDLDAEVLPSQAEIELTAQRIFGSHRRSSSAKLESSTSTIDPNVTAEEPFDFDLSQVLGALQSMKEEVSEIKDLDARRKAAARIAMGFAAGLGLGGGDEGISDVAN
ncbi:hypothetical protein FRB95_012507 [Tulasnella sp. JGI-2019a]|nr:hypothetical protein FRB95_012507 [Tulasnella sp. JGI-2019a]